LCPTLKIRNRDIGLEHSRLRELAGRASRFTPMVSREPPGSLLLEVSGSLRLFGGLHQLRTLLRADFSLRGHRSCIAVTPAPAASLLLAANEYSVLISRREALRSALGPLSVADLSLPHNTLTRLGHAGVRTLRDLWRLPSDGLALRFGPELTHYMNRLTGMSPEPRYNSTPSGKLVSTLELPAGTVETGYLLPVMGRLLNELGDWLRIRDAGTRSVRFFLYHPHRPATTISVGTRLVTRDTSRLLHLLDEHLNPVRLPEPVTRLTLAAGTPEPYAPECRNLFPGRHDFHAPVGQENEWAQVLDQLVARLGTEALHRPASPLDHRPSAENHEIGRESTERPVWILPTAQPLSCHHGTPRLGGRLSLAGTPERIETGWWDGRGVCRDYHVATDPQGGRLWVYRNADTPEKWHLQGYFS
ncbi:MAG: DNA polymerase Y family protein, partial [Pseudomonadota bacterium]|nr:DNA polymerase Y family protein [Pseudomonadota bacterium]